jgi:radical SAM protein with 4Fe4S-binding SPASM domain
MFAIIGLIKRRLSSFVRKIKSPLKLWNFLGLKAGYFLSWKKVPFLPITIDIEPTNTCNFKCPHCQVTHWDKKKVYLDENSFNKVIAQFPHLDEVKLQGMGEPLLNKQLVAIIKLAKKQDISIFFHSNGSVCDQKLSEQLATLKNTKINFSLDGATAETFETIRVGSQFERVKNNIQYLTHIRSDQKQPNLSAWTVITHENLHEVSQIVRLSKDLGLDSITLQPFLSNWGKEEMEKYTEPVKVELDSERLATALREAEKIAIENKVDLKVDYANFYSKTKKCPWPWRSTYIASNGDVVPCCVIADSDTVKMGNVFEKDFAEIWNSKEYQDFREKIINHDLPNYCKNCYIDAE